MKYKKKVYLLFECILMSGIAKSSIIAGKLSILSIQKISCESFKGIETYAIAKTRIKSQPQRLFSLNCV
jgi:hypothetical protein